MDRDLDLDLDRDLERDLERDRDGERLEAFWAEGGGDGGGLDFLVCRLLEEDEEEDLDLEGGGEWEEPRGAGEVLRERERVLGAGLRGERERRGEREADLPREREREREREELSERERLLDLFALFASMSLIFLPLISFPDSFSRAFFRSL